MIPPLAKSLMKKTKIVFELPPVQFNVKVKFAKKKPKRKKS